MGISEIDLGQGFWVVDVCLLIVHQRRNNRMWTTAGLLGRSLAHWTNALPRGSNPKCTPCPRQDHAPWFYDLVIPNVDDWMESAYYWNKCASRLTLEVIVIDHDCIIHEISWLCHHDTNNIVSSYKVVFLVLFAIVKHWAWLSAVFVVVVSTMFRGKGPRLTTLEP